MIIDRSAAPPSLPLIEKDNADSFLIRTGGEAAPALLLMIL